LQFATPESPRSHCTDFAQHRSALGQGQALSAACHTAVRRVLLNVGFILRIMLPSLRHQLPASFPMTRKDFPVAIVLLHSFVGALAWLMAFYVILVAGAPLIPRRFCFANYRRCMWTVTVVGRTPAGMPCV
jgi:hypothetical protein